MNPAVNRRALLRLALVLPLVTLAFAPHAGAQTFEVGASLDELRERGSLAIGVYEDFPPFSERVDGEWRGVDVDVARLIAEGLGLKLDLVAFAAGENVEADLRNAVTRGPITGGRVANLMLHVPYDRELQVRNELAVLQGAYHTEQVALAYDPERAPSAAGLAAFDGYPLAAELDSISDFWLSSTEGGVLREDTLRLRTPEAAVDALKSGRVVAVMATRSQIEGRLGDELGAYEVEPVEMARPYRSSWPIGFAVRTNARDLGYAAQDVLRAAVRDGTLEAIFADHGITWNRPEGL